MPPLEGEAHANYVQHGKMGRRELYNLIPESHISSVINSEIGEDTLPEIFKNIDELLQGENLDLIIGGPPVRHTPLWVVPEIKIE